MASEVFIPSENWAQHLANAIRNANSEETTRIVVSSHEQRQLGKQAHARMCPEKDIEFVIQ